MALAGQLNTAAPVGDKGFTFEYLAALAYATQNGAHAANFSAGRLLNPSNNVSCSGGAISVDKAAFSTVIAELDASLEATLSGAELEAGHAAPLFTTAIEDNCGGVDGSLPNNYDYPLQAFRDSIHFANTALAVAGSIPPACVGSCTSIPPGPFDPGNDLGADLAAPDSWAGVMLDDASNAGVSCTNAGSSFAAPLVAGVAGLVVSGNLGMFGMFATPNGPALRAWILAHDMVTNPMLGMGVPSQREITMRFLP